MEIILAVVIGGLYAAAVYMMLRRSLMKLLLGLSLLSHATNLLIFTVGGLNRGRPPVLEGLGPESGVTYADPLPQALILTAIVISFGVMAFALALTFRVYRTVGSDDLDQIHSPEA